MRGPRGLQVATYAAVGVYVGVLALAPDLFVPWFRDTVLGNLAFLGAVALLVHRAAATPSTRFWTLPLATGTTVYLVGNVAYMVADAQGVVAFPSVADVAYLLTYPFLVGGLLMALRENLRGARLIVALDGISGMLAGAAVTTLGVAPLVAKVWDGSLTAATTLAYPVCAVVALAATLGAVGLVGLGKGRSFLVWAAGMLVFGAGDILYAYRLAFDSYRVGTWLDALWPLGLVAGRRRRGPRARRRVPPAARRPLPRGRHGGLGEHRRGAGRRPALAAELPADRAGPDDAGHLRRTPGAGVPAAARARGGPGARAHRRADRGGEPAGALRRAGQAVRRRGGAGPRHARASRSR